MTSEWVFWRHVVLSAAGLAAIWLWFRLYLLPRMKRASPASSPIAVIDRTSIGPGREVVLVQIEHRRCLLGVTSQRIDLLLEFPAPPPRME